MKVLDTLPILADTSIPTYQRNVIDQAIRILNTKGGGSVEVDGQLFDKLATRLNQKPVKAPMYRFISIYDDLCNRVDIQTKVDMMEVVCGGLRGEI